MAIVKNGNVVHTTGGYYQTFDGERHDGGSNQSMVGHLISTVRRILDDAESEWDMDHDSPELKDKFCMLRDYIENLRDWCR